MSAPTRAELRAELSETLNAIEYRLNVPKRVKRASQNALTRIRVMRNDQPVVFVAVVGVVAIAGVAVVFGVRAGVRVFLT
jgi:hypothetical protein